MTDMIELPMRYDDKTEWFRKSAIVRVEGISSPNDFKQFSIITLITGARIEVQVEKSQLVMMLND
jgi:hypothetical protein